MVHFSLPCRCGPRDGPQSGTWVGEVALWETPISLARVTKGRGPCRMKCVCVYAQRGNCREERDKEKVFNSASEALKSQAHS